MHTGLAWISTQVASLYVGGGVEHTVFSHGTRHTLTPAAHFGCSASAHAHMGLTNHIRVFTPCTVLDGGGGSPLVGQHDEEGGEDEEVG